MSVKKVLNLNWFFYLKNLFDGNPVDVRPFARSNTQNIVIKMNKKKSFNSTIIPGEDDQA